MSEIEPLRQELESARGELVALREALDTATSDRERYRALYMQLLERCRLLERGIIAGQKAERFQGGEAQLSMRVLDMLLRPDEAETDADVKDDDEALQKALAEALDGEEEDAEAPRPAEPSAPRRRPRGRRKLPETLPRVEIELARLHLRPARWVTSGGYTPDARALPRLCQIRGSSGKFREMVPLLEARIRGDRGPRGGARASRSGRER